MCLYRALLSRPGFFPVPCRIPDHFSGKYYTLTFSSLSQKTLSDLIKINERKKNKTFFTAPGGLRMIEDGSGSVERGREMLAWYLPGKHLGPNDNM